MSALPATLFWDIAQQTQQALRAELRELPDTLFEGHYPGTPVLPGALLVDAVRQAAAQWRGEPLRLSELLSARYYAPVLPGDRVHLELQLLEGQGTIVQASISTARGPAVVIKAALCAEASSAEESPHDAAPETGEASSALDQAALRRLLPHRYPMLLVDHALLFEHPGGLQLVARKAVTANEPCYGRLPEGTLDWRYPEVFVMESFCQGCGVLRASVGRAPGDDRVPVLARIVRFRFLRAVLPGIVLEHHVRIEASTSDGAVFSGSSWADGKQVASVDRIVAALAPKF
jgi:3-hydroxymyristoyl/3-hydroxydecanoyl-(acyl carrier protein) dehydratase